MAGDLAGGPERLVRAELIRADRLRRASRAARRLWCIAPDAAAVCLAVAGVGRLAGWPATPSLALIGAGLLALAGSILVSRRERAVDDAIATELDDRADFKGELRSAYWFAGDESRDPWIDFHLARAAERLKGIDWHHLYPAPSAGRAKAATAVLALAALALALFVPGRAAVAASGRGAAPGAQSAAAGPGVPLTVAEILAKLDKLLIAAETGRGKEITSAEVRGLLEQLDKLQADENAAELKTNKDAAKQSKTPTLEELKAMAERAKQASEASDVKPEVRDALADMSDKLNEQAQAQNAAPKDPRDAATAEESQSTETAQAQAGNNGGKQDPSGQSVKEAAGAGGVGVIMMTGDSSSSKEAGLGLGGASGEYGANGRMPNLAAALRKETIEAAQENEGEKTVSGERRQTEHGTATAAYARTAPAPAGRGRSVAPPAVPETRRAALRSYFIRKQ